MKTPLGMEVGLDIGTGQIVLDGFPALRERGAAPPPLVGPCLLWPRSPISATAELFVFFAVHETRRILSQSFHLKGLKTISVDAE